MWAYLDSPCGLASQAGWRGFWAAGRKGQLQCPDGLEGSQVVCRGPLCGGEPEEARRAGRPGQRHGHEEARCGPVPESLRE